MAFFFFVLAAFLAGVITFLAPCTLPLLPAYFACTTQSGRSTLVRNVLFFGLGLSLVFVLLGVFAGTFGGFLLTYKKELIYFFGALLIVFGIFTFFEMHLPHLSLNMRKKDSALWFFGFGSIFGLTWTGCVGPVLGFVLVLAATTKTAALGGFLLFVYALGLIFPLFILSFWLRKLSPDSAFWKLLHGKLYSVSLFGKPHTIHSTTLLSGTLFIVIGLFILLNAQYNFTLYLPNSLIQFEFSMQEFLVEFFNLNANL